MTRLLLAAIAAIHFAGPALAQNAREKLDARIVANISEYCEGGQTARMSPDAVSEDGDGGLIVRLGQITCDRYKFGSHPYCGGNTCTVQRFAATPDGYVLTSEHME